LKFTEYQIRFKSSSPSHGRFLHVLIIISQSKRKSETKYNLIISCPSSQIFVTKRIIPITIVSYMSYVAYNILWQKISNAKNAACYILHKMI